MQLETTMLHINVMQLCMHVIPILGLFNLEASLFGTGSLKDKGGHLYYCLSIHAPTGQQTLSLLWSLNTYL